MKQPNTPPNRDFLAELKRAHIQGATPTKEEAERILAKIRKGLKK